MNNFGIEHRNFPGDWFLLGRNRKSNNTLEYYLNQINIDDYNIYKATNNFRRCTETDVYFMNYCRFLLIKKEIDTHNFYEWRNFIYNIAKLNKLAYLNRPFPNIDTKKIKIIEWQTLKNQTN